MRASVGVCLCVYLCNTVLAYGSGSCAILHVSTRIFSLLVGYADNGAFQVTKVVVLHVGHHLCGTRL